VDTWQQKWQRKWQVAQVNHRYRVDGPPGSAEPVEMVADEAGEPAAFRWRGRRYAVHAVLARWVEALPWWVDRGYGQRYVWRVEATSRTGTSGVYDLYRVSRGEGCQWGLERVID
jgi:hypothetical protein